MLTEIQRGLLIKDLKDNITTITVSGVPIDVKVHRADEGFDMKHPFITLKFMPTTRKKQQSISDYIEDLALGEHKRYGYAQIELVEIRCYAQTHHKERVVHGRLIVDEFYRAILKQIFTIWEYGHLLADMGACIDSLNTVPAITETTIYIENIGRKIYGYGVDLYLLTQFVWNDAPDDWDGTPTLLDEIGDIGIDGSGEEYHANGSIILD